MRTILLCIQGVGPHATCDFLGYAYGDSPYAYGDQVLSFWQIALELCVSYAYGDSPYAHGDRIIAIPVCIQGVLTWRNRRLPSPTRINLEEP